MLRIWIWVFHLTHYGISLLILGKGVLGHCQKHFFLWSWIKFNSYSFVGRCILSKLNWDLTHFIYNYIVFFTHHLADFLFSRDVKVSAQSIFQSAVAVVVKDKFYLPVRTSKDVVWIFHLPNLPILPNLPTCPIFLSRDIHGSRPAHACL